MSDLRPEPSAAAITRAVGIYLRWKESGDSSPANLMHDVLVAERDAAERRVAELEQENAKLRKELGR